ncbi:multicopper oxidase domain-containing protein [Kytococcus schroeteri]|uniref:multicopper oxidase domain-containing protein n=2 Tax=Kytococcus schroeteri TaxID=138300 RepID=UPI0035E8871F
MASSTGPGRPADRRVDAAAPGAAPAPARGRRRGGRWLLRDRPGVVWLALAVLLSLVHPFVPASRWLMVHLVLLGALSHSIMVWSTHFANALLRSAPDVDDRATQSRRLWMLLAGTCLVLVGVPTGWWLLTVAGAVLVGTAVLEHARQLVRRLRAALPGRFAVTVRYYVAAALCLPVGAALGATLARGVGAEWHGRLLLAHTMVNLLGWVGLTVTGTLLTLWPTMLRTRIGTRAEAHTRHALPVLVGGLVVVLTGALGGWQPVAAAGVALYAAGLLWWAAGVLSPVRRGLPREFAAASVGAALLWWAAGIAMVLTALLTAQDWTRVGTTFDRTTAVVVVGFAAQLLTGALSHLMPVVIGGGKPVVRAAAAWFDRWGAARLVTTNAGLLVCLLPVPSLVRVAASVLVLVSLASFVPLMVRAVAAAGRARREQLAARQAGAVRAVDETGSPDAGERTAPAGPDRMPSIWSAGQVAAALSALALVTALGASLGPATAPSPSGQAAVAPTGHTTRVEVRAADMRFDPGTVTVPAGDRVVLDVVNADTQVHDLAIAGQQTPRLGPGERATLDLGVVGADTQGWCTIVGHRQAGMVLDLVVEGGAGEAADTADGQAGHDPGEHAGHGTDSPASTTPLRADPDATVEHPVDPRLPARGRGTEHHVTLRASELELEVAPGVTQHRWTFNDRAPGPTLHGRVGDTFVVTLVNDGSMGHSIDFHAGALAPDRPMRTIQPGERLTYRFTAERSGIWMYHCSTAPMSSHIAAGMHGAVVVEPREGLPEVDREYVLVQSEAYPASDGGPVDPEAIAAGEAPFVTFNGIADQYLQHPLTARVGERVRLWVLDAGPNRASSFHVVGGQFDTVWSEGAYRVGPRARGTGAQVMALQPAEGGFVELTFPEAGHYPLVSHVMSDAERGARGVVEVTGAAR